MEEPTVFWGLSLSISMVSVSCLKSESGNNKWGIFRNKQSMSKLPGILGSVVKPQCCVQQVLTLLAIG